jgi:hypothetical protein
MEAESAVVFSPEAAVVPPPGGPNSGAGAGTAVDQAEEDPEIQNFFPRRLGATRHGPRPLPSLPSIPSDWPSGYDFFTNPK